MSINYQPHATVARSLNTKIVTRRLAKYITRPDIGETQNVSVMFRHLHYIYYYYVRHSVDTGHETRIAHTLHFHIIDDIIIKSSKCHLYQIDNYKSQSEKNVSERIRIILASSRKIACITRIQNERSNA